MTEHEPPFYMFSCGESGIFEDHLLQKFQLVGPRSTKCISKGKRNRGHYSQRFSTKVQDPDFPLDVHTTDYSDLDLPIGLRKGCDLVLNIIQFRTLYYVIIHRLNIMHLYQDCLPNTCLHKWNWEEALKKLKVKSSNDRRNTNPWKEQDFVDVLERKCTVGCEQVYKSKYNLDLVVQNQVGGKGIQSYGMDYFETFSAVADLNSARVILLIPANLH